MGLHVFWQVNPVGLVISFLLIWAGFRLYKSGSNKKGEEWVGRFHQLESNYELEDLSISHGVMDVKLDLTKAMIPEGEKSVRISGRVGDVTIYLPYDLEVSVNASALWGELDVLGRERRGFRPRLRTETPGYPASKRKVNIGVSLWFGDVSVRRL